MKLTEENPFHCLICPFTQMSELREGYLEMEEESVGCQCHSGWKGSQIS